MFILTVAVSAMLSLYVATARSMQRAGQKGTALTLAEKQMEHIERFRSPGSASTRH